MRSDFEKGREVKEHDPEGISIVITCFNRKGLIASAIESSLAEFPDSQIVIVDDCSTDGSPQFVRTRFHDEVASGRVKLIEHRSNRGVTAAKNTGFRNGDRRWILFLDSDDMIIAGCGDEVRDALSSNCAVPVVFFRCRDYLGQPVGEVLNVPERLDLKDFVVHTSKGEVLTAVNKSLVAPMLPYYGCLRGYEGLGICRILAKYGVAMNTTVYARIYNHSFSQNLSNPTNVMARARLLAFGHGILLSRFSCLMPRHIVLSYKLKVFAYSAMHVANSLMSKNAARFSKSSD